MSKQALLVKRIFQQRCSTPFMLSAGRANTLLYAFFKTLPPNTKVIFPAIMCPSPLFIAKYADLEPILCDVNPQSGLLDLEHVKKIITENPKEITAVISVNLYGIQPQNHLIYDFCKHHGVYLVEDAAQGWHFNSLNCDVDFSLLSFGAKKNIDLGSGGLILLKNKSLYENINEQLQKVEEIDQEEIQRLSAYYSKIYYLFQSMEKDIPGSQKFFSSFSPIFKNLYFPRKDNINFKQLAIRLNSFQQGFDERQYWLKHYTLLFQQFPYFTELTNENGKGSCWRYSVLLNEKFSRNSFAEYLRDKGIDVSCWYSSLAQLGFNNAYITTEHSEKFSASVLNFWLDNMTVLKLNELKSAMHSYFGGSNEE